MTGKRKFYDKDVIYGVVFIVLVYLAAMLYIVSKVN